MDSALAWFGQIFEWFGKFIPRWIILDVTQGGVKYVYGSRVKVLKPGIHFYWPIVTRIDTYPTVLQTDDLPSQTMESEDGVPFTVGGMVTYTVPDVEKLLTKTHSPMKMIQVVALAAIHEVCCKMDYERLKAEQRKGTLDTKLRHAIQRQLTDFGVKIDMCQLTTLVKSRALRLIQSNQRDEVSDGLTVIG